VKTATARVARTLGVACWPGMGKRKQRIAVRTGVFKPITYTSSKNPELARELLKKAEAWHEGVVDEYKGEGR
jgi:hypothetical protein